MPHSRNERLPHKGLPLRRASGLVLVADTPKGRGVFASQPIPSGTVIDISPVLVFTPDEVAQHTSKTCLDHYTYYWPNAASKHQALALGLGSLFNHSRLHQNVGWKRDIPSTCIIYTALRDIAANEELCISYGDLWFDDVDDETDASEDQGTLQANGKPANVDGPKEELVLSGLDAIDIDLDYDDPGYESRGSVEER